MIRYEDLLTTPSREIGRIGNFLGAHNISKIMADFESDAKDNTKKNNFNKWKTDMPEKDIEIFEAIAGDELKKNNYENVFPDPKISSFEKLKFSMDRLVRLAKLNIYHFGRKLPQDKKEWQTSKIKALFRPGSREK